MIRGKGDNMAVVQTGLGRVGGLICWESESISGALDRGERLMG